MSVFSMTLKYLDIFLARSASKYGKIFEEKENPYAECSDTKSITLFKTCQSNVFPTSEKKINVNYAMSWKIQRFWSEANHDFHTFIESLVS